MPRNWEYLAIASFLTIHGYVHPFSQQDRRVLPKVIYAFAIFVPYIPTLPFRTAIVTGIIRRPLCKQTGAVLCVEVFFVGADVIEESCIYVLSYII